MGKIVQNFQAKTGDDGLIPSFCGIFFSHPLTNILIKQDIKEYAS